MMNFDIHIDHIWRQSIFHVFDDVADDVAFGKRARDLPERETRALIHWECAALEGERGWANFPSLFDKRKACQVA